MASVGLTQSYLHLVSDISDLVRFPEAAADLADRVRSGVVAHADGTRRKVSGPAKERELSVTLPVVVRATVQNLRDWVGEIVLFRSPTGEYRYGQLLGVRRHSGTDQPDDNMMGATLTLDPVSYPGLI